MRDQLYWASLDAEELGEKLSARIQSNGVSGLAKAVNTRNARSYQSYFGMDPSGTHATSQILRGGAVGELAKIRINHTRSLLSTLLNLVVGPKVVWQAVCVAVDYQSLKQVELANAILEYYWRQKEFSKLAVSCLETALWSCESFTLLGWNEHGGSPYAMNPDTQQAVTAGELTATNINSWDVLRDPSKRSYDDLDWVIVRRRVNRYDLVARYPDQANEILEMASEALPSGIPSPYDSESDDICYYLFLHKRTAALPEGRETVFLQPGTVLEDSHLTFEEMPLYRVSAGEQTGSSYGYSSFLDILGIQEMYDSLHTTVASNQSTFAGQTLAIPDGSDFSLDSVVGGMRALYYPVDSKPPMALELCKTPAEVFPYLQQLKQLQELVFGLNSVVRGEPQSGEQSGSALALLQSQALQQSSVIQSNFLRYVENLGTGVLSIIKQRASVPQKIALVGKSNAFLVTEQEYTGSDLGGVQHVQIETGNPLSQTTTGRISLAQDLLEKGLIKTAEQYLMVLESGKLEPLTESLNHELLLIKSENEALSSAQFDPSGASSIDPRTGQPEPHLTPEAQPPVLVLDDHMLHAREHRAVLANPAARTNPAVVKAVLAHIDQHEKALYTTPPQTLAMVGQQSPMGGPQPGGPPPGAPPPAPGQVPTDAGAKQPDQPTNPATGQKWDPQTAGGGKSAPHT